MKCRTCKRRVPYGSDHCVHCGARHTQEPPEGVAGLIDLVWDLVLRVLKRV